MGRGVHKMPTFSHFSYLSFGRTLKMLLPVIKFSGDERKDSEQFGSLKPPEFSMNRCTGVHKY